MFQIPGVIGNPRRELEVDSNELARALEGLYSFPILPPHLIRKLARQILVVDILQARPSLRGPSATPLGKFGVP
jgi:hypothetical protein